MDKALQSQGEPVKNARTAGSKTSYRCSIGPLAWTGQMIVSIQRREFIAGLSGATAWSIAARAQQTAVPLIGFVSPESPDDFTDRLRAFRQGLGGTGYVEGRNVTVEYHWLEDQHDGLESFMAGLASRVTVIATPGSTRASLAAKAATGT